VSRCILFAEVPCFYASVERGQDPALAERPVIVGGDPRKHGVVLAASTDAAGAGVELEMPVVDALRLCPQARAVRTDMPLYREVSRRLFTCLRRGFERIEPFGMAGGYVDVSGATDASSLAENLRLRVRTELDLPMRVGIASGKFLARLAAGEVGEEGVRCIDPGTEGDFLRPLPATRIDGVGPKTAATLVQHAAHTIGDVVNLGVDRLEEIFGSHGRRIFALASGRDDAPVRASRHPQSLSREVTIGGEGTDRSVLGEHLLDLARHLEGELSRQGLAAERAVLKVRYIDQATQTRSQVLSRAVRSAPGIHEVALRLLERAQVGSRPIRGLGLQLGKLSAEAESDRQLELFPGGR
jgi:nucleotidyltransferase/DNA polymerase involved in DNA repair